MFDSAADQPFDGPELPESLAWTMSDEYLKHEAEMAEFDDWDGSELDPEPVDVSLDDLDLIDQSILSFELGVHERRNAEAAEVLALLDAYGNAMEDAVRTWGAKDVGRSSVVARSFLKQAALTMDVSEWTAGHVLDTAMELRDSFPKTWSVFATGRVRWRKVELVVQQAVGLDDNRYAEYDERAEHIVVSTPLPQVKKKLHIARERLQADTAIARTRHADEHRRVIVQPEADGQASLTFVGPALQIIGVHDALSRGAIGAAGVEGETRGVGQLRFDIGIDLLLEGAKTAADPERADLLVPNRKGVHGQVAITVPVLTMLGKTTEPATCAGYGPIDIDTATLFAGKATSWIRILTDPVTGVRVAMDRTVYEVPSDLKRQLRVRDETCRAPGCNRLARQCDIDHVKAWDDGGKTEETNLALLCRRDHILKHDGGWHVTLLPNGDQEWISPWLSRRYVTHPANLPEPIQWANPAATDDSPPPF